MDIDAEDIERDDLSLQSLFTRVAIGLVVLFSAVFLLSLAIHEPLTEASSLFVQRFGLAGIFVGVLITDASPLPLTHEPILLFAWSGGVPFWTIFLVASAGSVTAGTVGWVCGRVILVRWTWLHRKFQRYRVTEFLLRYGAGAVGIAALTPFPFAIATWTAGAVGMDYRSLLLGSLVRIPKVLFYLTLVVLGWSAGS